jgi:hypothetical protein
MPSMTIAKTSDPEVDPCYPFDTKFPGQPG